MKGFTLIELVIYIALLAFLIGGGIVAAFYIADSSQKNMSDINIQAEGNFILRKIDWALTGWVNPADLTVISPTSFSINKSGSPLTFSLNGGNLQLDAGSGALNLNSSSVVITPVSGIIFSITNPTGLAVNFTVSNLSLADAKTFTLIKYLRK